MPDDLVLNETSRWLQYAQEDLEAAITLQSGRPRHACLFAQQSAEKAIKSIFVFLDQRVPRSHDLDMLKNQLPDGWKIRTQFDSLSELSFWAVESRYPGDLPDATQDDSDSAVAMARDVLSCIEQDLQDHGFIY